MNKLQKGLYYLFHKPACLGVALLVRFAKILPDKLYLRLMFRLKMGYWMDFSNPRTFNEKLQWLKLYNRKPEYVKMVDKYAVKKYIAGLIGEEYIIPTYGVWENFDDIDFEALPNQFVLKTTHGGGSNGVVVCLDKSQLDIENARLVLSRSMQQCIYQMLKEWPYKDVKPQIIAEQYMVDETAKELKDYKFFCFNGRVEYYKIDFDRFIEHKANYFDRNGSLMEFGEVICPPNFEKVIEIPKEISKMLELAETISCGLPFARVDLYNVNGKIYFGEITFFPASGFGKFNPPSWDKTLGDLINITN